MLLLELVLWVDWLFFVWFVIFGVTGFEFVDFCLLACFESSFCFLGGFMVCGYWLFGLLGTSLLWVLLLGRWVLLFLCVTLLGRALCLVLLEFLNFRLIVLGFWWFLWFWDLFGGFVCELCFWYGLCNGWAFRAFVGFVMWVWVGCTLVDFVYCRLCFSGFAFCFLILVLIGACWFRTTGLQLVLIALALLGCDRYNMRFWFCVYLICLVFGWVVRMFWCFWFVCLFLTFEFAVFRT